MIYEIDFLLDLICEVEVGIHLAKLPQIFLIGLPPLVLPP
jgi:hypothetical protein